MIIKKKQTSKIKNIFEWTYFLSAREGFKKILQLQELKNKKILLPAYIGFSTREGSGVFDPIRETKIEYDFYRMRADLSIDIDDVKEKICANKNNILLLINYFGFVDEKIDEISAYAKENRITVILDCAHSFFTFLLDHSIDFQYAFFSIHKLFPFNDGGMVLCGDGQSSIYSSRGSYGLFNFDLSAIINKRIENYNYISESLKKASITDKIVLLKENLGKAVPQTFPVLLANTAIRDELYFRMNEAGFGVVSLYHQLVEEIDDSYDVEQNISSKILNLPVHQDADRNDITKMIELMGIIIKKADSMELKK